MAEVIDSDMTMFAATSFNNIIHHVQYSGLNYQLRITPFSANISIKKSLVKNREGYPPFAMVSENDAADGVSAVNVQNDVKLIQELDELKNKQKEYVRELEAVYKTVQELETTIALNDYVTKKTVSKEVQASTQMECDVIAVHVGIKNPESYTHPQLKSNGWRCDDLTDERKVAREHMKSLGQDYIK